MILFPAFAGHRFRTRPAYRWFALALPMSLALAGCDIGQDYIRPDTPTPPAWLGPPEPAAWPSADWWHGFRSARLDAYIAQAQAANFDIAAAIAQVREADAQAEVAGAPLLPAISGSASATRERASSGGVGAKTFTEYAPGLTASYEIDFWGKNHAALAAAEATAAANRFNQATVELTIMSDVATSYFQALELREEVAVALDNVKSAREILNALQHQETAGIATALDVAQQETTVATLEAAVPPLLQQLRQTQDALAILLGQPPEAVEITDGALTDLALPAVAPGLPSELLARRPDVAQAEANLKSANANITVARAAFFPSIQLTGSAGFASTQLGSAFNPANGLFSLAAALTQPIFEGGALEGQLEFTKARYDELVADYRKTVITAFSNAEDALVGVQQTTELLARQQAATDAARRAYQIALSQLRAGTINILTVLNTETALFTAETALVQARFLRLQALVALFNALGGGWQEEAKSP
jgi:NodT family efflux transporter outer membrane factor (OMF) lipoprotein